MQVVDDQGKLLGWVSVLDAGLLLVLLVAVITLVLGAPQQVGGVVQLGNVPIQSVEVDLLVRGVSSRDLAPFQTGDSASVIIRNQPYGRVEITEIETVPVPVPLVLADGEIDLADAADPYRLDLLLTLAGEAQVAKDGVVLGNNKVKIGTPLELETPAATLGGTVVDVRFSPQDP
ncbi:MAG: DUF4330 domain-containing protein [Synechococcaceae cyanobacterium SM2_3_1]|nr:DUF4330 domain-containing protein [Synechococcaceae cyanobacterium SM2_3_1]